VGGLSYRCAQGLHVTVKMAQLLKNAVREQLRKCRQVRFIVGLVAWLWIGSGATNINRKTIKLVHEILLALRAWHKRDNRP
jgi:hypothetical protein